MRTEPTCTVDGNQQQVCIKCGNFQTITLTSLGHDRATTWTVDETEHWHLCNHPNCTEKADVAHHVDTDKNHKCDVCDANVGEHVAAANSHVCDYCQQSMGEHVGGTATCTSQAICTICSEPYGAVGNHNLDATGKCTNNGCNYACTVGLVFRDIDETTTSVIGLVSDAQDIVIPQTYNGKTVTVIEREAFYGRNIQSVSIPSSITTIGQQAFGNCDLLEKVYIADIQSWINIDFAYYYRNGVNVEANPLANRWAKPYINGELVTDLVIPEGVEVIKSYAFFRVKVDSITIPSTLKEVSNGAFKDHSAKYVYTPSIQTWLGIDFKSDNGIIAYNAARGVPNLCVTGSTEPITDLVIPEGVERIGNNAFENYQKLKTITFNSDLKSIGGSAFYGCSGLTAVYLHSLESWINIQFERIWANPLEHNESAKVYYKDSTEPITELTIPQNVTEIGEKQFAGWRDLAKVTVHDKVTKLGKDAFLQCSKLKSVYITDLAAWCKIDFVKSEEGIRTNARISANPIAYGATLYVNNVEVKDLVIPEGVKVISAGAFWGLKQLTSVTLPPSVEEIGESAFRYCPNITAVHISDLAAWCNINFVLANVWSGEISHSGSPLNHNGDNSTALLYLNGELLEHLDLSNVPIVKSSAFFRCTQLKSITYGSATTYIGKYAFNSSKDLENIYITDLSKYIQIEFPSSYSQVAFTATNETVWLGTGENKQKLVDLVIPDDITVINPYTFSGIKHLESITLHAGVTEIGDRAFLGCNTLKTVNVPALDTWLKLKIYDSTTNPLYNKTNEETTYNGKIYVNGELLTDVTIPEWMEDIPEGLFYCVSGIQSVTLHSNVKSIGDYALYDGSDLERINVPSLVDWMKIDFASYMTCLSYKAALYIDGEKLEDIVIPESVTEIKKYTFAYGQAFKSVTLHENVQKIGLKAFYFCNSLEKVIIPSLDMWYNIEFGEYVSAHQTYWNEYGNPLDNTNAKLYVRTITDGVAVDEQITDLVIDENVTYIPKGAFFGAKSITSVTINGPVAIGEHAFQEASNITTVTINKAPESIGEYAFYESFVDKVVVSSTDEWVKIKLGGDWASPIYAPTSNSRKSTKLYLASDLENEITSIIVADGTTLIEQNKFANMKSVTQVTLPNSIETIEINAFANSALEKIIFNGSLEQWLLIDKEITRSEVWYGSSLTTIECTDGTLEMDSEKFFTIKLKSTAPTTDE